MSLRGIQNKKTNRYWRRRKIHKDEEEKRDQKNTHRHTHTHMYKSWKWKGGNYFFLSIATSPSLSITVFLLRVSFFWVCISYFFDDTSSVKTLQCSFCIPSSFGEHVWFVLCRCFTPSQSHADWSHRINDGTTAIQRWLQVMPQLCNADFLFSQDNRV